jgi:hypothetical protein
VSECLRSHLDRQGGTAAADVRSASHGHPTRSQVISRRCFENLICRLIRDGCGQGSGMSQPFRASPQPSDMPFKLKRSRHGAVAIPIVAVAGLWSALAPVLAAIWGRRRPAGSRPCTALGLVGGLAFRLAMATEPSPG